MPTMFDDSNLREISHVRTFLDAAEVFGLKRSVPHRSTASGSMSASSGSST